MIKLKKIHLSEVSEVNKLTQMEMKCVFGGNGDYDSTTPDNGWMTHATDGTYVEPKYTLSPIKERK